MIEQITKHLNKLIDVVKLVDLTEGNHIERELMLVKVKALAVRDEVKRMVDIFRAQIVDVTPSPTRCDYRRRQADAFLQAMAPVGILEVARTGVSGIARGDKVLSL